jgi:DNA-binding protein HU-beta
MGGSSVAKMMTKSATLSYLAEKTKLSKKQIEGILDETLTLAAREAKKNGVFLLPGFGKLVLAKRKARMGRNPQTGEPIKIPAKTVCKFRIAKPLKDTVLGKK